MYGYRQSNQNGLMTNLNSISSSLSSIDTIGRRTNTKASADNLIASHSIASTSLLWRGSKDARYPTSAGSRGGSCHPGSEIYYNGSRCLNSEAALNFMLAPLLLLTITRQVFDFLGQIWLQILINFFTIILLIVALFGIRQRRISYLSLFSLWALFNSVWNFIVLCIHSKLRDVGLPEDALSFYTGASSWWHSNGPGCLPYNISSIQPPLSILQPNIVTGCRLDYHLIESTQATIHAFLSLFSSMLCLCVISNIRRSPTYLLKNNPKVDRPYRLNNLMKDRTKISEDPFPNHSASRFGASSASSLRRAANKTSSRSSQHSVSSMRSTRRRNNRQQSVEGTLPTPRGSTSSVQRSQKYGSLSSRRSGKRERRSDISSLTYGTTTEREASGSRRTRLSSLSSADYLPSYQPPHSSSANLLSSYGEVSSIDSYNNQGGQRGAKNRQHPMKTVSQGNTNPTYTGSRSSVCSHNTNTNNYDDLSYIYGNNNTRNSESAYANSSGATNEGPRQRQQIYQQSKRNGIGPREQQTMPFQKIHAETHQNDYHRKGDTMTKAKIGLSNGSFHSFATSNQSGMTSRQLVEVNNNYQANGNLASASNQNQQQIYANQRNSRHPIYSNNVPNGNSETPI